MKTFFDTNVYVAEALLGQAAEEILPATNDRHLLDLAPYEGLRIVSMTEYRQMLVNEGLISPNP